MAGSPRLKAASNDRSEEDARSTSPQPAPSKTQGPATTEDNKAGEPRLVEAPAQGANGGVQAGTGNEFPKGYCHSSTYAEELRQKKKAELETRINKDNKDARKAEERRARMDKAHFALNLDKARKVNEARKRFKDQLEHPRNGGKYLLPESWTIFRSLKPKQTNIL